MTEEQKPSSEILDELEALGQQLVTAVKSLWESEDSRKLRQEIGEGFAELGRQIDTAVKSAQDSEAVQQFEEQVKVTVDKARESDIAGKLEQSLATGLRELNEQISKLVGSPEGQPEAEPEDESQG
jgi:heparin binding hemagglutinin HbhA